MENNSNEIKIINFLKDGEKSTTDISHNINRNFYDTNKLLEKLETENRVEKIEVGKFTFWRLINGEEI